MSDYDNDFEDDDITANPQLIIAHKLNTQVLLMSNIVEN